MSNFDLSRREAELQAEMDESCKTETWYQPTTEGMFGQPTDFETVQVEVIDGCPQRCLCGLYRDSDPDAGPIEDCEVCTQTELV